MKPVFTAAALLLLASITTAGQARIDIQEMPNVFPADAKVEQFALTNDGQRTYYTTPASGDVWLYDRGSKTSSRVVTGSVWDLAVSPSRDALVYTRGGSTRQEQFVWLLPLNPKTGLASGSDRRVSTHTGDVPSLSPDGKRIAFARDDPNGVGQSVVVVPIDGGDEQVVASRLSSSIRNIQWTPDGKTLYFGVNPPVPFTCAESCLTIPGGNPQIPGTIQRVSVDGGPATIVATTNNPTPGLSPDGNHLVFGDTSGVRQYVVADANGRRLDTFTLSSTQSQPVWSGDSTLLTLVSGTVRRLRLISLTGEASRVLFETDGFASSPAWSPDGKMVSFLLATANRCELRIMDNEGTLQKAIILPENGCGDSLVWTNDQRRLVYTQYMPPDRRPVIIMVEIATGQTKQLRDNRAVDMNWVLDANTVIAAELSNISGAQRRISFWQIELDGSSKLLREAPFDEPPGSFAAPIDRSTAIAISAGRHDFLLMRLDGGTDRQVALGTQNGYVLPRPSISADKQWGAFRINPSGNDSTRMNAVELIRFDGTERRTMELPFFAQTQNSLVIVPDAQEFIAVERPSPGADAGVYLSNAATHSSRKLLTYSSQGRIPEIVVSPDGRTVLGLSTETLPTSVTVINLSRIR